MLAMTIIQSDNGRTGFVGLRPWFMAPANQTPPKKGGLQQCLSQGTMNPVWKNSSEYATLFHYPGRGLPTPGTSSLRVNGINYPPLHLQEDIMNSIRPDQGVEELGWGIISHRLKSSAKPETAFHLTTIQQRKKAKRAFVLIGNIQDFSTKCSFKYRCE